MKKEQKLIFFLFDGDLTKRFLSSNLKTRIEILVLLLISVQK